MQEQGDLEKDAEGRWAEGARLDWDALPPLSSYRFRHNLFQKYLYDSLDAAQKAYLHEDAGTVLEALYGHQAAEIAVQLARHFEEAGLIEKAIHHLSLAGERAMRVSANAEAIGHLTKALTLLRALPASAERDQLELPLQMGLGTATIVAGGYAAPGVRAALDRPRELCCAAGSSPQLSSIIRRLCAHYDSLAEYRGEYELAGYLITLAEEARDPASLLIAYQSLGQCLAQMGDLVAARETLEHRLAYYDPQQYRTLAYLYGEEHGVGVHGYLSIALLLLGYPDLALAHITGALALAEALGHPHVLAYTLYGFSTFHILSRDIQAAQAYAEKTIALCAEKGIPFWRAAASINHGHVLALQGRASDGILEASQALSDYRTIGAKVELTLYQAQMAEMHMIAGQIEAALAAVEEGLAGVSETAEGFMEAELYRLRAEMRRRQGCEAQAEADLRRALEVARAQQARLWELRATVSLSRLWSDQGKQNEAHQMLAHIYGWFTEGFELPDLQEARALLEELADRY